ncbi:hypothetical protein BBG19_1326 [Francisella sp. MA067296]|nr:hypothetical protein BBG19_1326 [Francisella sp. MA067296]
MKYQKTYRDKQSKAPLLGAFVFMAQQIRYILITHLTRNLFGF